MEAKLDSTASRDELACIYAALILADDDIAVTAEKLTTILNAADVQIEKIWPALYAKALAGVNIKELITGAATSGVVMGGGGAMPVGGEEKTEEKAEEKPAVVEDDEDSDEDFGLGLFD